MSQRQVLEDAMRDLEQIFILNSRNTITDKGEISQLNGSVLRARQLSNSLTSNADDAVFLDKYVTDVLPTSIRSADQEEGENPAEPMGGIIVYHAGQSESNCRLEIEGDTIKSGYVSATTIADLLGTITQKNSNVNTSVKSPKTDKPSLGLIEINSPFLSLPTRNVLPVSLFCSSIPTLEMSRATPFVIVRVVSPITSLKDGVPKTLSIGSYLLGGQKVEAGTVERDIAESPRQTRLPNGVLVPAGSERGQQSLFGMEMFTMPQTLVNADLTVGSRGTPILNKFLPLMSLNNVSIDVSPAGHAAYAYKEASVNITIHDRSRMQEVAQLLRPDQFGYNFIELEYGWTHPEDVSSNNPYAAFINSFRQRELYTVVSSNMSISDNGSVSVAIRCGLKGARDLLNLTPISDGLTDVTSAVEAFKQLNRLVSDLSPDSVNAAEDIRYVEVIRSLSKSGAAGRFSISADEVEQVKGYIARLKDTKDGDLQQLRTDLIEIFGEEGTGGQRAKIVDDATTVFNEKLNSILSSAEINEFGKQSVSNPDIDTTPDPKTSAVRKYATFGKLVTCMLGSPMTKASFAEIQLYFYTFNTDAGAVNRRNIAEFPILSSTIRTAFSDGIKSDPKMPLKKMMRILLSLVNDGSAPAYGLLQPKQLKPGETESEEEVKQRNETNSRSMERYNCRTTSFKRPVIEYMMDSILIDNSPVLRIHFFDKKSTPNDEALHLLDVSIENGPKELISLVRSLQQGSLGDNNNVLKAAAQAGIVNVNTVGDKETYTLNTNNKALKTFIKRTVPSLTYGTPTSVMTSFSVQSIDMQDFETALLIQAANGTRVPGQPQPDSPQNDMQVYPMNFSTSILGCPLIDYAQEFFVDLDTGTSIDNIYAVNGISHTISPGSFKTDLQLKLTRSTGAGSAIDSRIRTLLKNIDDRITVD
jgi:hypothetical protein